MFVVHIFNAHIFKNVYLKLEILEMYLRKWMKILLSLLGKKIICATVVETSSSHWLA